MSTGEDQTTSDVEIEETVFKFGNSDLADVIFDVSGKEFHCHKMLLAAKCDYFASMFASGFKEKDEKRITIDADPAAFKRLMEIIYDGYIEGAKDILLCNSDEILAISKEDLNKELWKAANDLFALADRLLLTDVVRNSFQMSLFRYDRDCIYTKGTCTHCATKFLLALCLKMDEYKKVNCAGGKAIEYVLDRLPGDVQMSGEAMAFMLRRCRTESNT